MLVDIPGCYVKDVVEHFTLKCNQLLPADKMDP